MPTDNPPSQPLTSQPLDYSLDVVTPPSMATPLTAAEIDGLRKYAKHPSNLLARCVITIDALHAEIESLKARMGGGEE